MEVAEFVVNAIHGTNANDYSLYQYDEWLYVMKYYIRAVNMCIS